LSNESTVGELLGCIKAMNLEIESLKTGARTRTLIPEDAVIIVDATECPSGWTSFDRAHGRFVVGVGEPERQKVGSTDVRPRFYRETDGETQVRLTPEEMPEHKHSITVETWRDSLEEGEPGTPVLVEKLNLGGAPAGSATLTVNAAGLGQPHNNMPPYIALYFCKKDR
jgi:hypothetical protein